MRTQLVDGLLADLLQDVRFLRVYWECIHDTVLTIIHAITFLGSVRRQDRVSNQSKVTLILMKRLLAICIVDFLAFLFDRTGRCGKNRRALEHFKQLQEIRLNEDVLLKI